MHQAVLMHVYQEMRRKKITSLGNAFELFFMHSVLIKNGENTIVGVSGLSTDVPVMDLENVV